MTSGHKSQLAAQCCREATPLATLPAPTLASQIRSSCKMAERKKTPGFSVVYRQTLPKAKPRLVLCFQGCDDSKMTETLDHVILPKHVTDAFYATLCHCYEDIFASSQDLKPKATSLISQKLELSMARSLPAITGPLTGSLALDDSCAGPKLFDSAPNTRRVGENIDEFIRNNRQELLLKRASSNDVCDAGPRPSTLEAPHYRKEILKSKHCSYPPKPSENSHRPLCTSISLSLPRKNVYNIFNKQDEYNSS